MADWVNNGSIRDVSDLSKGSIGVRTGSMAATNTVSVTPDFGAPGTDSESVKPEQIQSPPVLESDGPHVSPGDDGKQKTPRSSPYNPGPPAWKPTQVPDVVRDR